MASTKESLFSLKAKLDNLAHYPFSISESHYDSASQFIDNFMLLGDKKKILLLAGLPGRGKTRFRRIIADYITKSFQESITPFSDHAVRAGIATWEGAEQRARVEDLIKTPKGKSLKHHELYAASRVLRQRLYSAISDFQLVICEAPIIPAVRIEQDGVRRWVGRELGALSMYYLAHQIGRFERFSGDYEIYAMGFTAGPQLSDLAPIYRVANRKAKSLRHAQAISLICGINPPRTKKDWIQSKEEGATLEEMSAVSLEVAKSAEILEAAGVIPTILGASPSQVEYEMLKYVFSDAGNLNIPPERQMFVYNNPDLSRYSAHRDLLNTLIKSEGEWDIPDEVVKRYSLII